MDAVFLWLSIYHPNVPCSCASVGGPCRIRDGGRGLLLPVAIVPRTVPPILRGVPAIAVVLILLPSPPLLPEHFLPQPVCAKLDTLLDPSTRTRFASVLLHGDGFLGREPAGLEIAHRAAHFALTDETVPIRLNRG